MKKDKRHSNQTIENDNFSFKDEIERATGFAISDSQEKQIIDLGEKIFGSRAYTTITGQIMTPKGQDALSTHRDGMVKILGGQADAKITAFQGAVNAYLDVFTTKSEQIDMLTIAQKQYGIEDLKLVEVKLAENFINYTKIRRGASPDPVESCLDRIYPRIMCYLFKEDEFKKLFTQLFTKGVMEEHEGKNRTGSPVMKNLPIIIIGIILAAGWFYWFQYKPSQITKYCNGWAGDKSRYSQQQSDANRINYEALYKKCQREQGLK